MVIQIVIMLVCVLLSSYFSATETAFSSLNRTRLKSLAEQGSKKAKRALKYCDNYDKLISTILIGNNIVNIALASIGTIVFVSLLGDIGATVSTAVITVVVLIFGEITPKSIAKDAPEKFAMFAAPSIGFLMKVFTPLNYIFSLWKKMVAKLIKVKSDQKMSQAELLLLVDEVQQEGTIDDSEGDLIRNVLEFGDLKTSDVLTHRVDIEAVDITSSKEEIAKVFTDTSYSRLPVYEETVDKIIGVIHQKDFYIGTGMFDGDIKDIMTSVVFVSPNELLSDLLPHLQREKAHMAMVIDEYGGTLGVVTMEDILEELVGEIWDEHDEVEVVFKKTGNNTFTVDCSVNFDDFCDYFGIEAESESVSLGGWIMEMLRKVPEKGDEFVYEKLKVTVTKTDLHRPWECSIFIQS